MKKRYSEAVCAAYWIIAFVAVFAECATAQTALETVRGPITETRHAKRAIPWNNYAYFETRKPTKFLNWSDYMESVDKKTLVTWFAFAGAAAMWGARERYHANPYTFEQTWGVDSESFWGSDAWKRNYLFRDPTRKHKSEIFGNVGRDVHHTFGFGSKALLVGGTFSIGARNQPIQYRVANMGIAWFWHWLFANITYQTLR